MSANDTPSTAPPTPTERMMGDLVNAVQRRLNSNGLALVFSIMVWRDGEPETSAVASTLDPERRPEIAKAMRVVLDRWLGGAGR